MILLESGRFWLFTTLFVVLWSCSDPVLVLGTGCLFFYCLLLYQNLGVDVEGLRRLGRVLHVRGHVRLRPKPLNHRQDSL